MIISNVSIFVILLNVDQNLLIQDVFRVLFFIILITSILVYLLHLSYKRQVSQIMQINKQLELMADGDLTNNKIALLDVKNNEIKKLADNLQVVYNQMKHHKGAISVSIERIITLSNHLKTELGDYLNCKAWDREQILNSEIKKASYFKNKSNYFPLYCRNKKCKILMEINNPGKQLITKMKFLENQVSILNNVMSFYRVR